jgi:3'-phosphoadenosine 5'-phosphosulfate sulfotransferase (PAPS reductase)/FAD synthetase
VVVGIMKVYDLFVSGGKDSVVSATIAYEEAKSRQIPVRVVFINEIPAFQVPINILPFNPLDYVKRFSEWLGVELIVLEPKINYWEGVKKWGYPHIIEKRWCFELMKREVLKEFIIREMKEGYTSRTWVLGIRVNESSYRRKYWANALKQNRWLTSIGGYTVEYYLPIASWSEEQVDKFIRERKIPENPAWRYGFSFECLCLAGTPLSTLDRIIAEFPKLALWLAEKDKEVQASRRSKEPGYILALLPKRMTLHEYIEKKLKQPRLTQFITDERQNERL